MPNPHGTPIWYELLTPDPDGARTFYGAVIGWRIEARPAGELDYRMIDTADAQAGGVMRLTDEMAAAGARPGWLFYVGVDDVDASVAAIAAAGGHVLRGAWDIPGIGRMALVADPGGAPFYVMRGASAEASRAFVPDAPGKCGWNELTSADQAAAHGFYGPLFGWSFDDRLEMPGMGDYVFIDAAAGRIGATMQRADGMPPAGWRFYFRVPDVAAAAAAVGANGGLVQMGPTPIPTGERIAIVADPDGAAFGLLGG